MYWKIAIVTRLEKRRVATLVLTVKERHSISRPSEGKKEILIAVTDWFTGGCQE